MKEKIKIILSEVLRNMSESHEISDETDIINDLGLDSLQMINFLLKLEDEFSIEIDYERFNYDYLRSVNKLCDFLSTGGQDFNFENN